MCGIQTIGNKHGRTGKVLLWKGLLRWLLQLIQTFHH